MARETTLVYDWGFPLSFTVADGTGIAKGAILKMTDPMTAIINSAANDTVAGIAVAEKIASDGVTRLAVSRSGVFKGTASGAITVGDPIAITTPVNYIKSVLNEDAISGGKLLGTALETAADGDTFLFILAPTFGAGSRV